MPRAWGKRERREGMEMAERERGRVLVGVWGTRRKLPRKIGESDRNRRTRGSGDGDVCCRFYQIVVIPRKYSIVLAFLRDKNPLNFDLTLKSFVKF